MVNTDTNSTESELNSLQIDPEWYATPKSLANGSYDSAVHDMFRNRSNVWVQRVSRKTALDLWPDADTTQETNEAEKAGESSSMVEDQGIDGNGS
jgi:hypothetical protein